MGGIGCPVIWGFDSQSESLSFLATRLVTDRRVFSLWLGLC